ncbi:hypothetical protein DRP05_01485 [Archaeoglobales archaeon]|nr:MAG: hypothetical protein DRP05_01485 [Archaeoglobales archaeon]
MDEFEILVVELEELLEEFRSVYGSYMDKVNKSSLVDENRVLLDRYLIINLFEILITESNGEMVEHMGEFIKFAIANAVIAILNNKLENLPDGEMNRAYA